MAQLGSAPRSGRGGRRFKSCQPDHVMSPDIDQARTHGSGSGPVSFRPSTRRATRVTRGTSTLPRAGGCSPLIAALGRAPARGTLRRMADKDPEDDGPSLELPSFGFGRKRKERARTPSPRPGPPTPRRRPVPRPTPRRAGHHAPPDPEPRPSRSPPRSSRPAPRLRPSPTRSRWTAPPRCSRPSCRPSAAPGRWPRRAVPAAGHAETLEAPGPTSASTTPRSSPRRGSGARSASRACRRCPPCCSSAPWSAWRPSC